MATRSEQYRAEQQRRGNRKSARQASRTKPGVAPRDRSRSKAHAGKKATYALDADEKGRPSRKSSRKSANRAKPDASLTISEALRKESPEARFRQARARAVRTRGKRRSGFVAD